jgi:DNA-binding NtrC family response regulator
VLVIEPDKEVGELCRTVARCPSAITRAVDSRGVEAISASTALAARGQGLALILEDDPSFQAVLGELLTDEGLEYRVCDSYPELRAAADEAGVHVIVADFWGTSYVEPTTVERQEIRELGRMAPTIVLTGRSWARHELPEELGVMCLLAKPVDLDRLVENVRRCLEIARSARAAAE